MMHTLRVNRLTVLPNGKVPTLPCGVVQAELSASRARYDTLIAQQRELERLRDVGAAHGFDVSAFVALIATVSVEIAF